MRDVRADGVADFLEGFSVACVGAVEVADAILGQVGHVGEAAFHASVVAVIDEAVVDAGVVAEAVTGFQALLSLPGASGSFHAIDVGCGQDRLSVDRAAIEIELHVRGHVIGGSIDGAGGTLEDVPVGIRCFAVVLIEGSELRRRLLEIGGRLHADGQEEVLRDVVLEALAGELFNDVGGDGRTGVAIGHAGSRRPARDARVVVVVEAFAQRHALGVFGVLGQMQIVPAGGVFEQVDDADRVGGFPAILEIDLRDQLVHRVLE